MRRTMAGALLMMAGAGHAGAYDDHLAPTRVADGVYFFEGKREHFSRDNGGNIVNTGFIQTPQGTVVIDTGPSRLYGEAMRARIAKTVGDPRVAAVYLTHAHPDHFLGNQAFADVPIYAAEATRNTIRELGDVFADALYRLVGAPMAGTVAQAPDQRAVAGPRDFGGRMLDIHILSGHAEADLVVLDRQSGTLFAGDLVFFERALTTPSADIAIWLQALDTLQALPFTKLVPGHGPLVTDASAIAQTRDYLSWLRSSLHSAARAGLDIPEVLRLTPPDRFAQLAVLEAEYERSVVHLYPDIELEYLTPPTP